MQKDLNRIFGDDFKVKEFEGGFKINVSLINSTQLRQLVFLHNSKAKDINLKRSGTGITIIVTV